MSQGRPQCRAAVKNVKFISVTQKALWSWFRSELGLPMLSIWRVNVGVPQWRWATEVERAWSLRSARTYDAKTENVPCVSERFHMWGSVLSRCEWSSIATFHLPQALRELFSSLWRNNMLWRLSVCLSGYNSLSSRVVTCWWQCETVSILLSDMSPLA